MADVIYKKGQSSNLDNVQIKEGQILVTEDTGEMYVDVTNSDRKKINDTNLKDGSSIGSIRSIGSKKEDSSYKIGRYAMAEGLDTQSGAKAFTIVGVDKTNKTYTLDSVEGLEIGDVYSVHVLYTSGSSSQKENYGKITDINGNVVTVDNLWCEGEFATSNSYISDGYDGEKNTFRIITKPNVGTRVIGDISHAEGVSTKALSKGSHAEGKGTVAHGSWSHAEGNNTKAGYGAHAEGNNTKATGFNSHAEGNNTTSSGLHSHAEGNRTTASGFISHAEGSGTTSSGGSSHAEGDGTDASGFASHTEGDKTKAIGYASHAEGSRTEASGITAHAEGDHTVASGYTSHAQGRYNISNDNYADVIGNGSSGTDRSNAATVDWQGNAWYAGDVYVGSTSGKNKDEGSKKLATEEYVNTISNTIKLTTNLVDGSSVGSIRTVGSTEESSEYTIGTNAFAEGYATKASGDCSHAEGDGTDASGDYSHAEGYKTKASRDYSHAEGAGTTASGFVSHAEGSYTTSSGNYSHAEGYETKALGNTSHAEGSWASASSNYQHVQGKCNIADSSNTYADIIGNGSFESNRSNAATVDWDGNAWYAGAVTSNAADYAEFFEWLDGNPDNEDRVGYLVALDGEKIRFANLGDEILGIISANPAILGDNYECNWNGKYLTDEFGRILYDKVEEFIDIPKVDEETGETTIEKKSLGFFNHPRINPDYDPNQEYINRRNRSEWAMVGMLGKLFVRDEGTAQINGNVSAGEDGIATASTEKTNMRVLSRANDHIVKVLLK